MWQIEYYIYAFSPTEPDNKKCQIHARPLCPLEKGFQYSADKEAVWTKRRSGRGSENKNFPMGDFTPSSSLLPLITLANKSKLKM